MVQTRVDLTLTLSVTDKELHLISRGLLGTLKSREDKALAAKLSRKLMENIQAGLDDQSRRVMGAAAVLDGEGGGAVPDNKKE